MRLNNERIFLTLDISCRINHFSMPFYFVCVGPIQQLGASEFKLIRFGVRIVEQFFTRTDLAVDVELRALVQAFFFANGKFRFRSTLLGSAGLRLPGSFSGAARILLCASEFVAFLICQAFIEDRQSARVIALAAARDSAEPSGKSAVKRP